MEKILCVTQLLPYPAHSGGKYKTLHTLTLLSKVYDVHLFCLYNHKSDARFITALEKELHISVTAFYQPLVTSQYRSVKGKYFLSLFSSRPFSVFKYDSAELRQAIEREFKRNHFVAVYCDHETSFQFLDTYAKQVPLVYDEHNLHSVSYARTAALQPHPLFKLAYYYEAFKHRVWEKKILDAASTVIAISPADARLLQQRTTTPVTVLPVPFRVKNHYHFSPQPRVLFVGLLSWPPNKQGLLWFIHSVWPLLRQRVPGITFDVIGAKADLEIKDACDQPGIHLLGEVENLEKKYAKASVVIAPIFTGSGVRIKILHALAAGLPVVSTSLGSEGIPANRSGVKIADTPIAFANAISQLCSQKEVALRYHQRALSFMKRHHAPSQALQILRHILASV